MHFQAAISVGCCARYFARWSAASGVENSSLCFLLCSRRKLISFSFFILALVGMPGLETYRFSTPIGSARADAQSGFDSLATCLTVKAPCAPSSLRSYRDAGTRTRVTRTRIVHTTAVLHPVV